MWSLPQINDTVKFCSSDIYIPVIGFNKTLKLYHLWITDLATETTQLRKLLPVTILQFLVLQIFHFTKDESNFTRFTLEMIAINPKFIANNNNGKR